MNDFTKDELEIINGYVKEINRKYESTDEMDAIAVKIQSMIDDLTFEKPPSICECNDEYHPNGAICL